MGELPRCCERCYHGGTTCYQRTDAVLPLPHVGAAMAARRCSQNTGMVLPRCRWRSRLPRPEALLPPRRCCRRMTALLSWWWRVAAMLWMCCCRCGGAVRAAMARRQRRCCMAQGRRWCCPRLPGDGRGATCNSRGCSKAGEDAHSGRSFFFQRCFNIRFFLLHLLCGFATI